MDVRHYDITILSTYEALMQFHPEWESLYRKSVDATAFLSFEWVSTIIRHLGNDTRLRIGIIRYNQEVIAIVPFEIKSKTVGPLRLQVLYFLWDEWPLQNSALYYCRDQNILPSIVQELIAFIFKSEPRITCAILTGVPIDTPYWTLALSPSSGIADMQTAKLKIGQSVIIRLPTSIDEYRSHLSKAHKKAILRHLNVMHRNFKVRLVRLGLDPTEDGHEVNNLMRDALAVSHRSWQGSSTKGRAISDADTRDFFEEVSRKLAQKGMLDLSVLYADDKPVSFIWGTARWPHSTIIKLGFDQSFKQYSPGTIHLIKYIDDSIERNGAAIDFGHEYFSYKSRWSKHYVDLYTVYYFPQKPFPLLLRTGHLFLRKVRSLAKLIPVASLH